MADASHGLFEALFGNPKIKDRWMYTWKISPTAAGGLSTWYMCKDYQRACNEAWNQEDVYFGLGIGQAPGTEFQRIPAGSVAYIPALWVDVDYDSPFRKKERLPKCYNDIATVFNGLPEPSYQVDSGYGLHCYWIFEEPYRCDSVVKDLIRDWAEMFKARFSALDFNIDMASSAAQVLRVPGSLNSKDPDDSKIVSVVLETGHKYSRADLLHCLVSRSINYNVKENLDLDKYNFMIEPEATIDPDKYALWCESYRQFAQIWDGSMAYPSQSERDMAIAAMLRGMAEDDQTIVDALVCNRRELGQSDPKLRFDYYARTLAKSEDSELAKRGRVAIKPIMPTAPQQFEEDPDFTHDDVSEAVMELKRKVESLTGLWVKQLIKRRTLPVSYDLRYMVSGIEFRAVFEDIRKITSQGTFLAKIMEQTNRYIPPFKKAKWEKVLEALLPLTDEISGQAMQDYRDEFADKVNEFINCQGSAEVASVRDVNQDYGCFHVVKENKIVVYCSTRVFQRWHNREGFPERLGIPQISALSCEINGRTSRVSTETYMIFNSRKVRDKLYVEWGLQGLPLDDHETDRGNEGRF